MDLLTFHFSCTDCSGVKPSVHMIDPTHFDRVNHDDVVKKWGVSSDKLGDVLALAGDSSDNIPGVPVSYSCLSSFRFCAFFTDTTPSPTPLKS